MEEELEFLETRPRRRRINVGVSNVKDEPPKSKVFTCGTNINPRQIPASVKVVDVEKPKMIRDVATNTPNRRNIKNTQTDISGDMVTSKFASNQSEKNRVDCMTQIGWVRAQKAQQVDDSIISAALEVNEPVPSIASATDGAVPDKSQVNFTTGQSKVVEKCGLMFQTDNSRQIRRNSEDFEVVKDSLDSADFAAHIPTRAFDFETRKRGLDIITQTDQIYPDKLVPGTQEFTRVWNNTQLQTECDIDSIQFETVPQSLKSYNVETQNVYPQKAHGITDGRIKHAERGQQTFTEESNRETETRNFMSSGEYNGINRHLLQCASEDFARDISYCELKADDRSLSDLDIQFSGPKMQKTSVANRWRPRVADECTCYKITSRQFQKSKSISSDNVSFHLNKMPRYGRCETSKIKVKVPELRTSGCQVGTKLIPKEIRVSALSVEVHDKMVAGKLELPMRSVMCPASVFCQPILTEERGIQMVDVKDVDSIQIQTDNRSYLAGVQSAKPIRSRSSTHIVPKETCFIEFRTDPQLMNSGSVNFVKSTTDRSTHVPRVLTEAECQFKVTSDLTATSSTESTYLTACGMKPSQRHRSCQVGAVLLPETMEVSTVPLNLTNIDQIEKRNIAVDAVICPTKVKVRPVLTEDVGIHVAKTMGLHQMNVKIADKVYNATVSPTSRYHSREIEVAGSQICTVEIDCREDHADNYTMTVTPAVNERGLTINLNKPPRQLEAANQSNCPTCHCQLETSWSNTETSSHKFKPIAKSTQVGTVLEPVRVQIMNVSTKSGAPSEIRTLGTEVPNIICPSTVELVSTLVESSGIKIKDVSEVGNVNIARGESTFYANVRSRSVGTIPVNPLIRQGYFDHSRLGTKLGKVSTEVKRSDDTRMFDKPILQQAKFEIVSERINGICEVCNGTGKTTDKAQNTETFAQHDVGCEFSIRGVTKGIASNLRPVVSESINAQKSRMHSVETQVGAVLKPTRVYMANVEIQPRTTEIARQMGMTPNVIICPSTIELNTQLGENVGIQVMDAKDVSNMEVVAGSSIFESSFVPRRGVGSSSISTTLPVLGNVNIVSGRTGLTLGQESTNRPMSSVISNNETFVLQDIGCNFAIKDTSIGVICEHCHGTGRVEQSLAGFSSIRSTSMDLSRKPSFIHQRASTPLSKNAECQVGVILRPQSIQLSSINVSPKNRTIAGYLGLDVDSVLCPANLQMTSEIGEMSGIKLLNVRDESCIKIQAGDALLDANLESRTSDASSTSRRKPEFLMNLHAGPDVFTLGPSTSQVPNHTLSESFRLSDAGCEIVLRDTGAGRVCTSCQGTGRMATTSIKSSRPFEVSNIEQYGSLVPAVMVNRSARSESKSCQVGVVLTPTNVNIAPIEMFPRNISRVVASGSVVYPAAVDLESRLMETSGIQIKEVANTDEVTFIKDSGKFGFNVVRNNRVPETCTLEVRSANPVSSGKFSLQNIGCEFRLKEAGIYALSSSRRFTSAVAAPQVKHVSSQVGLSLVPKTVQVADMSATASDKRAAANLGLKADALICPSSIDLEMNLTETGGVSITDIKEVKEVAIKIGESRGVISITGRNMKTFDMASRLTDAACLTFICNKPLTTYQGARPPLGKPFESTTTMVNKMFDQNARCTFRLGESGETSLQISSSSKSVGKTEAGCQVGVLMVPRTLKVSTVKMVPEDKASSNTIGVAELSTLQASTCELEPRISERTGIQIAQVDAIQKVQLELGGQIYTATVIPPRSSISSPWSSRPTVISITGFPISGTQSPLLLQRPEASVSDVVGPYLLSLKDGATQKQSIVEVAGLTLGGKIVQLRVNADLRDKLFVQSGQRSDRRFTGYLDSSQRPSSSSERYHANRPDSRLCDVACEALIKPKTLEKRLQTFFI